ncbi:hypothetical protein [Trinickia sp. EG282A]|uniref:hypothetical protein n=1 Tax=Trinickia sp. EG282A TaxID=3237013 RepID=UPI0034D1DCCC
MSNATISLLQRLFKGQARVPEYANINRGASAERLAQVEVCARHGYFNMTYTPIMFPFVAEVQFD